MAIDAGEVPPSAGVSQMCFLAFQTWGLWVLKTAPMIQRNIDMRKMPTRRGFLRPKRSTPKKMKTAVAT